MCGNFGLLALANNNQAPQENTSQHSFHKPRTARDDLDASVSESMHQVSRLQGMRFNDQVDETSYSPNGIDKMLSPVKILEAQTACTEIRGGQAGGYSSIEYKFLQQEHQSGFEAMFGSQTIAVPRNHRVRMVARKRHPLASDLSAAYLRKRSGKHPDPKSTITVIGHTRFATSSVNIVSELHPHEWVPFHDETIWTFNADSGRFERSSTQFGLHITHNGDFDAMEAYSSVMVVDEIGLWLERALNCPNNTRGDSPKVAGCMDLMRVQGRWSAAARLSWLRCICSASSDVSGGIQLSKTAPNAFPLMSYWELWASIFETVWPSHINNVIIDLPPNKFDLKKKHTYRVDRGGIGQLEASVMELLRSESQANEELGIETWNDIKLQSFVHHTVRGFLFADLYTVMTEILSRAEGSFGLQAHCTIEPGVVVIASKGQPMSMAFDPTRPIALFASEAEALAVPVYESGKWLPQRIDLDSKGEIFRIGEPRALQEGSFGDPVRAPLNAKKSKNRKNSSSSLPSTQPVGICLDCGLEIRSYSLVSFKEAKMDSLIERCVAITSAPLPYDPKVDLVANDLKVTPAVLDAIDHAWSNPQSIERLSGQSLAEAVIKSMQLRVQNNQDLTDLIIGGIEVSLWMAEQWAADLRRVFPNLNVTTTSANKLLGLGEDNASKVFFPGSEEVLERRIGPNTCILLVSQSGQTFPTLHATRKLANGHADKIWIITGCFNSKMEQALMEGYRLAGLKYGRNRVFNNYSGHRPAEPSSVAVAATWHTFTKLLLHIVDVNRTLCPAGRMIHPWDYDEFAWVIQRFFLRYMKAHRPVKDSEAGVSGFFLGKGKGKEESKSTSKAHRQSSAKTYKIDKVNQKSKHQVVMNLSDGCIQDIKSLISENLVPNISQIVGYDHFGNRLLDRDGQEDPESTHNLLVEQGLAWATHILEPWNMLICASIYIFLSISLGLPIVGLIADAVLRIVRAGGANLPDGIFLFAPRFPWTMRDQGVGYTLLGFLFQACDALVYIYIGTYLTKLYRIYQGRPLAARAGNRTIVIVDNACVHQLVEIFVSKLFSQSYSMISVTVHGAVGLDHFVHRFTHRVVRGLLIAVGRPDGRLCCLAKSEMATLLATKQAAFIRNPDYKWEGNGPEIITIGHNPFQPNLGLAKHIVLHGGFHRTHSTSTTISATSQHRRNSLLSRSQHQTLLHTDQQALTAAQNRNKFVDEYLYDRLFLAKKPFTVPILRALRRTLESGHFVVKSQASRHGSSVHHISNHNNSSHHHYFHSMHNISASAHSVSNHGPTRRRQSLFRSDIPDEVLPYGVHHIDPTVLAKAGTMDTSVLADFITANWEYLNPTILEEGLPPSAAKFKSNDPSVRLAFASKLDSMTRQIQDLQVIVQQLYECRVASLERYLAFCVMFHAMAKKCSTPWLLYPWDIARSQSNLRVATTASPISAGGGDSHAVSTEAKQLVKELVFKLRKIQKFGFESLQQYPHPDYH